MSTAECSSPSHDTSDPSEAMDCSVGDDDYIVQVRAQVMTRDDSSGGWLPTNGGGMSVVGVQQGAEPASSHYKIRGRRVCDQAMVLDCAVTDDLLYVKATPTFHHWRTRGKRFGLTFHSSADAQVFESCIQRAALQLQEERPLSSKHDGGDGDDESVTKLQPPIDTKEVSSLPASRTRTPSPCATMRVRCTVPPGAVVQRTSLVSPSSYYPFSCPHLDYVGGNRSLYDRRDQLLRKSCNRDDPVSNGELASGDGTAPLRSDGYVRFSWTDVATSETGPSVGPGTPKSGSRLDAIPTPPSSAHDYDYPVLASSGAGNQTRGSLAAAATSFPTQPVSLPRRKLRKGKGKSGGSGGGKRSASTQRARCVYCQELFYVGDNRAGSCPDAPDGCVACIEHATCLCAARALLYHCATDDDGSYGTVCGAPGESSPPSGSAASSSDRRQRRKWAVVALLSIVLPCMWCYPAMAACHRCAVRRGHCGARHKAV